VACTASSEGISTENAQVRVCNYFLLLQPLEQLILILAKRDHKNKSESQAEKAENKIG
jgi:hypothetical protein